MNSILPNPCPACPYRKDVASGVWAPEEYDKLPPYDAPTGEQPFEPFACHASPDYFCHGWAVCHSNRGGDKELIALRLAGVGITEIPPPGVPLFASGQEASDHGRRDIYPGEKAAATISKLLSRHERLRKADDLAFLDTLAEAARDEGK